MVDMAHIAGLVAAGLHPSPIPSCTCELLRLLIRHCVDPVAGSLCVGQNMLRRLIKRFSRNSGGPLMHVIAKRVALKEALTTNSNNINNKLCSMHKLWQALLAKGFSRFRALDNHPTVS